MYGNEDLIAADVNSARSHASATRLRQTQASSTQQRLSWVSTSANVFHSQMGTLSTHLSTSSGQTEQSAQQLDAHVAQVRAMRTTIAECETDVRARVAAAAGVVSGTVRVTKKLRAEQLTQLHTVLIPASPETDDLATVSVLVRQGVEVSAGSVSHVAEVAATALPEAGSLEWISLRDVFNARGW